MDQHVKIAIGLGSNLGDRAALLTQACRRLGEEFLEEIAASSFYESEPYGIPAEEGQGLFLNAVVVGKSVWKPPAIVNYLKRLESELGRQSRHHYGPREIDLDLLLFGNQIFRGDGITVPHPGVSERDFVLLPLLEVWPEAVLPPGGTSVSALWADLQKTSPLTAKVVAPPPRDIATP